MKQLIFGTALLFVSINSFADCNLREPVDEIMQCIIDEATAAESQTTKLSTESIMKESKQSRVSFAEQKKQADIFP